MRSISRGNSSGHVHSENDLPDGGYGWVVLGAVFWNNVHQWGIASSYGVFLSHYLATSAFPNATPMEFAFIGGLIISQALMIAPIAANITRICGVRITLMLGVLVETLALVGASFATEIWHLFLSQGICFGWGVGLQYNSTVGIIPQWFDKRRGLASGIAAAGSGTGGLIYSLASNAMIQSIGVAWTYRVLAIIAFVVNTICALLFRDRNKQVGARPAAFNPRLFQKLPYCLFLGWCFLSIIGFIIVLFSFDDYAQSVGLTAQQGSIVNAVLNLGQAIGRPAVGLLSDKIGRLNVASIATLMSALLCYVGWIFAKNEGGLVVVSLLLGVVFGTYWTVTSPVAAEVVQLQDLPAGLTMMWLICAVPAAFSEVIVLELRQPTGNQYLHGQLFAASMFLGAGLLMLGVRTWKVINVGSGYQLADDRRRSEGKTSSTLRRSMKLGFQWKKA